MKIFSKVFFLVMLGMVSVIVCTSSGTIKPTPHYIKIRRTPTTPTNPPIKPYSESEDNTIVQVWYDYNEMTITFSSDEGDCTVGVYNNEKGTMKKYRVSTTESTTIQTGDIRRGWVRMLTEAGNWYEGTIFGCRHSF